nr:hypothetical protein GCM10025732_25070 [Glycomyces mayteni]
MAGEFEVGAERVADDPLDVGAVEAGADGDFRHHAILAAAGRRRNTVPRAPNGPGAPRSGAVGPLGLSPL